MENLHIWKGTSNILSFVENFMLYFTCYSTSLFLQLAIKQKYSTSVVHTILIDICIYSFSDNNSGEKKNEGCEERLKGLIEKYSNCDKSVPTSSPDSEMGKEELSGTAVLPPAPPSVLECSNEGTGEKAYMKRFVQKLLEVSALKVCKSSSVSLLFDYN